MKHLECRLRFKRLTRSPVLEVRRRREQILPHRRWETTSVCEHAPSHGAQRSPHALGHTDLLQRVGGGHLLNNTGLQAILPKLFPGVLAALVGAVVLIVAELVAIVSIYLAEVPPRRLHGDATSRHTF